jgi:putative ABC transport system substrate-binding protein
VDRRAALGGMAAGCVMAAGVRAQPAQRVRRIGWLWNGTPFASLDTFHDEVGLKRYGWVEGTNLVHEFRFSDGDADRMPALAKELVDLNVDVLAPNGTVAALAAQKATRTLPIVFWLVADPVRVGLVSSLARPGANITGTTTMDVDLDRKRIQILRELMPGLRRVGVMLVPTNPVERYRRETYQTFAPTLGIEPIFIDMSPATDFARAVGDAAERGAQLLHVSPDPILAAETAFPRLLRAAQDRALPIMFDNGYWLERGALISCGPNGDELMGSLAMLLDKVLRGAKPADLPVVQARDIEIGINLRVAKSLGIAVPPALRVRANVLVE